MSRMLNNVVVARRRATLRQKDPPRLAGVERLYRRTITSRLAAIAAAIREAIVDKDVFGFTRGLLLHVELPPEKAWGILDLAGKNKAFAKWLNDTLQTSFLEDVGFADATPAWIQSFIRAAYTKGVGSSLVQIGKTQPALAVLRAEALIKVPFHQERIAALFERNFAELKGFSSSMSTNMQRIIADGLLKGDHPRAMAREITSRMGVDKRRAELIARSEIIRTNAEAQLNTFERFGVADVSLEAEWITAGDDRVCPDCDALAGRTFSIEEARGMIPLHPACRCAWIPVVPA